MVIILFSAGLNPNQRRILEETKESLKQGGYMKEELWPKSGRFISTTRFNTFKNELHKNPVTDAVNLAIILFGTNDVALQLFRGTGFGLQAALGPDVIRDITGM